MAGGYIKLYRSMLDWGWYGNVNTKVVFLHLLLTANYEDGECEGHKIPRGSCVCSLPGIASAVNLSIKNVRTAIDHLKSTGEVAVTRTSKFSIITINNYEIFQGDGSQIGSQAAVNRQSSGSQSAPSKEYKKERNKELYNNKPSKASNAGASYDIEMAVKMANSTVPTVRKRETR